MFKKNKLNIVLLLLSLFLLFSCKEKETPLTISFPNSSSGIVLEAELADTPELRQLGLMYRRELPENGGMFFVFPKSEKRSFWMKNTYLELDIIYIRENFTIDSIVHNATPHTTNRRESRGPAKYVLEVLGGKAKEWNLKENDKLKVEGL